MKKRILIFTQAMELGGAEISLIGLLNSIDFQKYDVDLFLLRHDGELMPFIPNEVNILPPISSYNTLGRPLISLIKSGHFLIALSRLCGNISAKAYAKRHKINSAYVECEYSHKYTKWLMPKIQPEVEYDMAVGFLAPHYFVCEKVRAKKKIGWIHTDYTTIQIDTDSEIKIWSKLDNIISISDSVTETFGKVFPSLQDRLVSIENILPKKFVKHRAEELDVSSEMPDDGSIRLLTVGRFTAAKRIDDIPELCSLLIAKGINLKWYIIGYGGDESLIRHRISEYHMENNVIIIGKKENPYPYIKACDVYVQPSRYEGKCVAVREAQMLEKPVIITNYATSSSQLDDGVDGVIVPMDIQDCASGIAGILQDKELQTQLIEHCKTRDYSNAKEIEKFYKLIEE